MMPARRMKHALEGKDFLHFRRNRRYSGKNGIQKRNAIGQRYVRHGKPFNWRIQV
jgi:hypothetical protein